MNKLIDNVRLRCGEKLESAISNSNHEETNKYEIISNFLLNDRCFLNVDRLASVEILQMLGYTEDDSYDMYDELTSYENIKGDFVFEEIKGKSNR